MMMGNIAAFLTQTVQLDESTVKFEIWYVHVLIITHHIVDNKYNVVRSSIYVIFY
jgi:hypothetical protein